MARRKSYIPVTIEARQSNGEWFVRNAFINRNALVEIGTMDRKELLSHARDVLTQWIINYNYDDSSLRISNGGK